MCVNKVKLALCFPIGGFGSVTPARRTWSRTESSGEIIFYIRISLKFCVLVIVLHWLMYFWRSPSIRGRTTTSPRQQTQGTHTLWLSSARWERCLLWEKWWKLINLKWVLLMNIICCLQYIQIPFYFMPMYFTPVFVNIITMLPTLCENLEKAVSKLESRV